MKKIEFMDKYPLYVLELNKNETSFKNVEDILEYLKGRIENHKVATYIGIFDHLSHTKSLEEAVYDKNIIEAKNIIFCFGKQLPKPEVLGVRPRSIGICEYEDRFVVSFMEAPNPEGNASMIEWVESIKNR